MKKLVLIICIASSACVASAATGSTILGGLSSLSDVTDALASYRSQNDTLLEEMAELRSQYAALTNMVKFIENKCEYDGAWRRAYHQGLAGTSVATNEFGIIYALELYNDGYLYANYRGHTPSAPDPEAEARIKAEIAARKEEALAKMQRVRLPEKVAEILAQRRTAANAAPISTNITISVTSPITPNS